MNEDVALAIDQAFLINGRVSIDPWLLRELLEEKALDDEETESNLREELGDAQEKLKAINDAAKQMLEAKGWQALEKAKRALQEAIE